MKNSKVKFPKNVKFQDLLRKKIPIRFSCLATGEWPIIVSLWYLERNGKIYCATQKKAKIISYLKKNPKCGFEIASENPPYIGIRGIGKVVLNEKLGLEILKSLIARYLNNEKSPLAKFLLKQSKDEIAIEIIPTKIFSWDYSKRMKES